MSKANLAAALVTLALLSAPAAHAAPSAMISASEKLTLKGNKGGTFLRPAYTLGEYSGVHGGGSSSTQALGVYSKQNLKADFTVMREGWASPVTVTCAGGQGRLGMGWVTFKRDTLDYVCTFGGSAPNGASFTLAMTKSGFLKDLTQPQRAAELQYGDITLRAQTKSIGLLSVSSSAMGAASYMFTKGEQEIGGIQLTGFSPAFYLPPKGSPDRDAVAILSLIIYFFKDPGVQ